MHLSYYFLRFISAELRERLIGYTLAECYLQNRNECVLGFHNNKEEFFIKLNLYQEFTCLTFPAEFSKNKKGTYNLFKELNGLKVINIVQHENDRSFHIVFENDFNLMFKLYGSRSNLVLFHQNNCLDIVNKNLAQDREIDLTKAHKIVKQDFENFVLEKEDLRKVFPAFDKEVLHQLNLLDYSTKATKGKWAIIQEVLKILTAKKFLIQQTTDGVELSFFSKGKAIVSVDSAIEAANYYDRYFGQAFYFQKEKLEVLNYLGQKRKKITAYLTTVEQKLKELQEQTRYDEIANILMANLHQVPKNVDSVELFNFYTDKLIKIKIKGELTPQKNAENYYRKYKNQKIELAELEKNISNKKSESVKLQEQLDFIEHCEELKILRKYKKENNLLEEKVKKEKEQESLFRRFEIEGFEILVGKSAKNNDVLIQKYSFKEDLWLHARDVAGSHVLIKYKAGKTFPKSVIEKAAQLAAYYSKRKTDSLCPVIVTPKKFVRKPKGALEGQVLVEREEVLLVKPAGFDDLEV
ncbi:MAG TPA: NFACT RNA binding domain-containing protein [Cytophagaceae bacterium]|jgi:predicted ribosome quality control (RQC) complex YloA/Tae2 family protein|nr:NFACT RNA binding domain-containing protein [Cytophagaceae bacterium]